MTQTLTRLMTIAALAAAAMSAQHGGPGGQNQGGTPPDPTTFIQRRIDSLAKLLDLTDAQKTQALKIFTDAQTANSALRTQLSDAHTSIEAAVKKNDIATIESASAKLGTLTGQAEATQAKADAAFYQLLTPDQQAKFDQLHTQGPGRGGFPGMSRRPGGWTR